MNDRQGQLFCLSTLLHASPKLTVCPKMVLYLSFSLPLSFPLSFSLYFSLSLSLSLSDRRVLLWYLNNYWSPLSTLHAGPEAAVCSPDTIYMASLTGTILCTLEWSYLSALDGLNCKINLYTLPNLFVQIAKNICANQKAQFTAQWSEVNSLRNESSVCKRSTRAGCDCGGRSDTLCPGRKKCQGVD